MTDYFIIVAAMKDGFIELDTIENNILFLKYIIK